MDIEITKDCDDEYIVVVGKTMVGFIFMWFCSLVLHTFSLIYPLGAIFCVCTLLLYVILYIQESRDALVKLGHNPAAPIVEPEPPKPRPHATNSFIGWVYLVQSATGHYKIGQTTDLNGRLRTLSTAAPIALTLVHSVRSRDFIAIERRLHKQFAKKRLHGEWFALNPEDVEYIKSL